MAVAGTFDPPEVLPPPAYLPLAAPGLATPPLATLLVSVTGAVRCPTRTPPAWVLERGASASVTGAERFCWMACGQDAKPGGEAGCLQREELARHRPARMPLRAHLSLAGDAGL